MERVREIVTLGLEARQKAGIKVRQPLGKLEIKNFVLGEEYTELIKDEINIKEVVENKNIENEVLLDTKITEELKQEGDYRELVRALQDMRKKIGLTPNDIITLVIETKDREKQLIKKFEEDMKKTVLISEIEFSKNDGEIIKIDEFVFKIKIEK
jgi:isoleucyl-tRNA synthetase